MTRFISCLFLLFLGIQAIFGQTLPDSSYLDKNFKFEDGIFMSFDAFKGNKPAYQWQDLKANIFTNPLTSTTYVKDITVKDSTSIQLKSIWGLSLAGLPYINTFKKTDSGLLIFALLKVRGSISVFEYNELKTVQKTMHAYNPRTGVPFRTAEVERQEKQYKEVMLDIKTGDILPFNKANLLTLIDQDPMLVKSVEKIPEDQNDRLMKSLLIYCDRNPVKVPVGE